MLSEAVGGGQRLLQLLGRAMRRACLELPVYALDCEQRVVATDVQG